MVTVKAFGVIRAAVLCVLVVGVLVCEVGYGREQSAWGIGNTGADVAERTEEAVGKWQDARFGMFIHWGPVSLKGTEIGWSRGGQVPREEYDNLYKTFNPVKFDAAEWVGIAKAAGMKYMVLTSKHHDGFCLWDTKQTDYNIMNTPFGRDVIRELADECRKQGIVFCTYYSILDWYHPDYNVARTYGGPGYELAEGVKPDMDRYIEYMNAQLRELVDGYGPLGVMWFDGEWEKPWTSEYGGELYKYVKGLQGDIIVNNRVGKARRGMAGVTAKGAMSPGDHDTPEQQVGAFQRGRPWETCMTICRQWAWKPKDTMKSLKECIRTLVVTAGGDGNLLFNVGPMPDGRIEPRQVARLKEMGQWLGLYGESIYGTRGGPFKPGAWGVSTCTGKTIYVHVFEWSDDTIVLPVIDREIISATLLGGGKVTVKHSSDGITIGVPKRSQKKIDTVVKLILDRSAESIAPVIVRSASVASGKKVSVSNVYQDQVGQHGADKAVDDDDKSRWATDAGTKQAQLEVDLGESFVINKAIIKEAYAGRVRKFRLEYKADGKWVSFHEGTTIGERAVIGFEPVTARYVRLNILDATEGPTIWEFQLLSRK